MSSCPCSVGGRQPPTGYQQINKWREEHGDV